MASAVERSRSSTARSRCICFGDAPSGKVGGLKSLTCTAASHIRSVLTAANVSLMKAIYPPRSSAQKAASAFDDSQSNAIDPRRAVGTEAIISSLVTLILSLREFARNHGRRIRGRYAQTRATGS